jgi:hypothetical protein
MGDAWRNASVLFVLAGGVVIVVGAFRVLLVEHAVRMHAEGMCSVVP